MKLPLSLLLTASFVFISCGKVKHSENKEIDIDLFSSEVGITCVETKFFYGDFSPVNGGYTFTKNFEDDYAEVFDSEKHAGLNQSSWANPSSPGALCPEDGQFISDIGGYVDYCGKILAKFQMPQTCSCDGKSMNDTVISNSACQDAFSSKTWEPVELNSGLSDDDDSLVLPGKTTGTFLTSELNETVNHYNENKSKYPSKSISSLEKSLSTSKKITDANTLIIEAIKEAKRNNSSVDDVLVPVAIKNSGAFEALQRAFEYYKTNKIKKLVKKSCKETKKASAVFKKAIKKLKSSSAISKKTKKLLNKNLKAMQKEVSKLGC